MRETQARESGRGTVRRWMQIAMGERMLITQGPWLLEESGLRGRWEKSALPRGGPGERVFQENEWLAMSRSAER